MAVRRNLQSPLALALPVLAGILAPTTAAEIQVEFKTPHVPTNTGLRGLVLSMHRMFGEILLPTEDPAQLIRELQSAVRYLQAPKILKKKVAFAKGTDIAFSLLQDTGRILGLVGLCFSVALVVPLVALGILCGRFLCGFCGGGVPSVEPENVGDVAKRKRWSIGFCVLTGLMTFMLLGAFITKDHISIAVHGAKKQAYFLVTTLPLVIDKHLQVLDELVVTNLDQLEEAVTTQAKSCEGELTTAVGDILNKSQRLKFLYITLQRLQTIERRLDDIEAVITGSKVAGMRFKINSAFSVLHSAATLCSPPCDAHLKQELTQMALQLDIDSRIKPLHKAMDFKDDLSSLNITDRLGDIPIPDVLTKTIEDITDAIYSGLRRVKRGFCGLYVASWVLSAAVVLFQLLFPVALLVSTLSLAVGTVFDRFLCFPAQHPGSPASLVIIDFLLNKAMEQARAVGRRHITENSGALLMVSAVAKNGSHLKPVSSSWKLNVSIGKCWDSTDEEQNKTVPTDYEAEPPMPQQRVEQDVRRVMPRDDGERWRLYQAMGRKNVTRTRAGLKVQKVNLVTLPDGQLDHSIDAASTLKDRVEHGTDVAILPKGFTKFAPEMLLKIGKRFGMCSADHLSFVNLLGDDLMVRMARRLLGARRNQLLRLIERNRAPTTLDAFEQLSGGRRLLQLDTALTNMLSISPDVISSLGKVSDLAGITPTIFHHLAEEEQILNASMDLSSACTVDGKDLAAYISENLKKWDSTAANTETSVASLVARIQRIKTGFNKDLQKYFSHAKTQVRDHFGDCHSLYVMYMTTVDTACNGGVRLFAGFWFSVWLYLVLGIPAWMVALATSTLYTRISAATHRDVC